MGKFQEIINSEDPKLKTQKEINQILREGNYNLRYPARGAFVSKEGFYYTSKEGYSKETKLASYHEPFLKDEIIPFHISLSEDERVLKEQVNLAKFLNENEIGFKYDNYEKDRLQRDILKSAKKIMNLDDAVGNLEGLLNSDFQRKLFYMDGKYCNQCGKKI